MLVDVVCMRENGRKLPGDLLRTLRPARGELTIELRHANNPHGPTPYRYVDASLHAGKSRAELLLPLREAWVGRLRGDAFVVYGFETYTPRIGASFQCPQAWWCRLVLDLGDPLLPHSPCPAAPKSNTTVPAKQ